MKREAIGRDLPTSVAMVAAAAVLAFLYGAALATPLWLWSLGLLELRYALGLDAVVLVLLGLQYASLDRAALRGSPRWRMCRSRASRSSTATSRTRSRPGAIRRARRS